MVNYGVYTDATSKTLAKPVAGATAPYGTLASEPLKLKLLKGAMWNAGFTIAAGAAVAASLY